VSMSSAAHCGTLHYNMHPDEAVGQMPLQQTEAGHRRGPRFRSAATALGSERHDCERATRLGTGSAQCSAISIRQSRSGSSTTSPSRYDEMSTPLTTSASLAVRRTSMNLADLGNGYPAGCRQSTTAGEAIFASTIPTYHYLCKPRAGPWRVAADAEPRRTALEPSTVRDAPPQP
jgi:hypothetical protein